MRPFDLDLLRSFTVAVELGSLSQAAPHLCRSQSALSEQLRKLEAFAGVTLLERGKMGVWPTPAGQRLLVHARELLALSDRALEDVRGVTFAGELRLAITDYFLPGSITKLLKQLRLTYPRLRVHVSVQKSMEIESRSDPVDFDIGLSMRILDGRSLPEGIPLRREALHWLVAPGFAAKDEEQSALPLLVLPQGCNLERLARERLDVHKVPYVIAHSASGVAGLQAALMAGLGVACLNASAVPPGAEIYRPALSLPELPEVEFSLLPERAGESALVGAVREMLANKFRGWDTQI